LHCTGFQPRVIVLYLHVRNSRAITNINHHWCSICLHILCAGLQLTLASNYFGPVYLTNLLLDVLKASAPSRVVYEASLLEQWGKLNWDDLG